MSTHLCWELTKRRKVTVGNSVGLKLVLQNRYGFPVNLELSESDLPYLQGLKDGEVDGVDELISAIEKYDSITVTEEE